MNLIQQHFTGLDDLMIGYIKELPKYRLHFATKDIEIELLVIRGFSFGQRKHGILKKMKG